MSTISPTQQMRDYFSDEEEKGGPHPFQISKYTGGPDDKMLHKNKQLDIQHSGSDSERGYKDAFMALKEPE